MYINPLPSKKLILSDLGVKKLSDVEIKIEYNKEVKMPIKINFTLDVLTRKAEFFLFFYSPSYQRL